MLVSWWRSPLSRLLCPGSGFWLQSACVPQMLGDFGLIYFCFGGSLPCTCHWSFTRLQPPLFDFSFFECEFCNLLLLKKKTKQKTKPLKIKLFIFLQPQNAVSRRLHLYTSQLYFLWLETVLGVIFDEKIQWNQMLDVSFYFLQYMLCVLRFCEGVRAHCYLWVGTAQPHSPTHLPAQSIAPCLSHTYCPNSAVPGGNLSVWRRTGLSWPPLRRYGMQMLTVSTCFPI